MQNLLSSSPLSKNVTIKIYGTVILCVIVYGCETWSHTEKHRLGVFQNRVLRKVFRGKRDEEVRGECRRLHKENLYDLYSSPNITRVNK